MQQMPAIYLMDASNVQDNTKQATAKEKIVTLQQNAHCALLGSTLANNKGWKIYQEILFDYINLIKGNTKEKK